MTCQKIEDVCTISQLLLKLSWVSKVSSCVMLVNTFFKKKQSSSRMQIYTHKNQVHAYTWHNAIGEGESTTTTTSTATTPHRLEAHWLFSARFHITLNAWRLIDAPGSLDNAAAECQENGKELKNVQMRHLTHYSLHSLRRKDYAVCSQSLIPFLVLLSWSHRHYQCTGKGCHFALSFR